MTPLSNTLRLLHKPYSWVGHIPFLEYLLVELKPRCFVELGVHTGNSFFAACRIIQQHELNTQAIAVDTWRGDEHAGTYDSDVFKQFESTRRSEFDAFTKAQQTTFDEAAETFTNHTIDLLHIDGLHTYEAVKHDFETWRSKLTSDAVVLFHDIAETGRDFGVHRFWAEIQTQYPGHLEFTHSHGLGVLFLNPLNPIFVELKTDNLLWRFAHAGSQLRFHCVLRDLRGVPDAETDQAFNQIQGIYDTLVHEHHEIRHKLLTAQHKAHEVQQQHMALTTDFNMLQHEYDQFTHSVARNLKQIIRLTLGARISKLISRITSTNLVRYGVLIPQLLKEHGWRWVMLRIQKKMAVLGVGGLFAQTPTKPQHPARYHEHRSAWLATRRDRAKEWLQTQDISELPKISVVMPVYNPNTDFLDQAIDSISHQIYPNWELCIADDCSTDPNVKTCLDRWTEQDSRIHVIYRDKNGHISEASNTAISAATGAWIALMDQDDLLIDDSLVWVVRAIMTHPEGQVFYSDEEKFNDTRYFDPYFKPDFGLETFLSQNIISHLGVYRAELIRRIGGFRVGFEGSQDYDLALRALSELSDDQIIHIPHVLYSWRVHEDSTSSSIQAKPYASDAALRSLNEFLARQNLPGQIDQICLSSYRWFRPPTQHEPKVSILIPTKNRGDLVKACIESIFDKTTYSNFEIVLIDNRSDDPDDLAYFKQLEDEHGCLKLLRDDGDFNFSRLNNRAAEFATGELLLLLNNDTEVIEPTWLWELVQIATRPGVGCVGAKLLYSDQRIQHGGVILGLGGIAGHAHHFIERDDPGYFGHASMVRVISAVTAACLMVRKSIYQELGGLNETDLKVAFNDVDFCLRVMDAGYRNIWSPYALLFHHESVSRGRDDAGSQKERFAKEVQFMAENWGAWIQNDPYYNPHLSLKGSYAFDETRIQAAPN